MTTVLELAGQDQSGLLADVTHLLTTNGCDVRSAAVRGFLTRSIVCSIDINAYLPLSYRRIGIRALYHKGSGLMCPFQGHQLCMPIQVWTFKNRVAFVLSVTDRGEPVRDGIKLQRLQQLLCSMMDQQGNGIVNIKTVCTGFDHPSTALVTASLPQNKKIDTT